ncbi:MAG: DUF4129 domain-containing protein [Promethearchaeota archaeon]
MTLHQEKKVLSKKSLIATIHTLGRFNVNTKDFNFMLRKEFLILCLLMLTVTFAQVSLGQMSGTIKSRPFFILDFSFFEVLGVVLPMISGIYIYLSYRTKHEHPWILFILSVGVIIIAVLTITSILGVYFRSEGEQGEEPIIPFNNTSTSPISTTPYTAITEMTQQTTETTEVIPPPVNLLELNDFFQSLQDIGIVLLFFIPLLLMILIRRRSEEAAISSEDTEDSLGNKGEYHHKMRTVLECYYQASTALEERGADSSSSFTPTEFSKDVVNKTLTSPPTIKNLTNVFEEVKFSNHSITDQQVKLAKALASEIIFSDSIEEEDNEIIED